MSDEIRLTARLDVENLLAAGYEAEEDWEEVELKLDQTGYRTHKSYQTASAVAAALDFGPIDILAQDVWFMAKNVSTSGVVGIRPDTTGDTLLKVVPGAVVLGQFAAASAPAIIETTGSGAPRLKYLLVEV